MIRIATRLLALGAAVSLAACASAPLHYYTLVAPADAAGSDTLAAGDAARSPSLPFELLAVGVPAQVDQPQLVVREGGQGVALLGSERWIAPLGDEVRSALSADLSRALRSQDVTGLPGNDRPVLRITLDLRRFDSLPGRYALIEGAWSVRLLRGDHPGTLACTSRVTEPVGAGIDALVQGHQRAIARMAAQIASAARAIGAGQPPGCPAG